MIEGVGELKWACPLCSQHLISTADYIANVLKNEGAAQQSSQVTQEEGFRKLKRTYPLFLRIRLRGRNWKILVKND